MTALEDAMLIQFSALSKAMTSTFNNRKELSVTNAEDNLKRAELYLRGTQITLDQYNQFVQQTLMPCVIAGEEDPKKSVMTNLKHIVQVRDAAYDIAKNVPVTYEGMPASEAIIRAREAVIAVGYVPGLSAETQVRDGEHDDWLVTQAAYTALVTKDLDIDVLRKHHAPQQIALAKQAPEPVVIRRARRSPFDILMIKIARWFDCRSHGKNSSLSATLQKQRAELELELAKTTKKYLEQATVRASNNIFSKGPNERARQQREFKKQIAARVAHYDEHW